MKGIVSARSRQAHFDDAMVISDKTGITDTHERKAHAATTEDE